MMTSILKKFVMGVTGLLLVGFLVSHLAGNLTIYLGAPTFNAYAGFLESQPALVAIAELGLLLIFLTHIFNAFILTRENSSARPKGYEVRKTAGESTLASRTMWWTGLVVLVFVIMHVWHFKYGPKHTVVGNEPKMALYERVVSEFQNSPLVVALYVIGILLLGLHISHGIGSMFQSLGLFSQNRRKVRLIGRVIGWTIAIGFASLPISALIVKPDIHKTDEKAIPTKDSDAAAKKMEDAKAPKY